MHKIRAFPLGFMRAAPGAKLISVSRFSAPTARAALILGLLAACTPAAIDWEEPVVVPPSSDSAGTGGAPATAIAQPAGSCPGGVRIARDAGSGESFAAWWAVRPDSTAELVVARSTDGVQWGDPVKVDTLDAGRTGCRRMAPAIVAYAGHVQLAYAMAAKEGPGIFASHSMDRGQIFHSPVAVVYGERLAPPSIAARGDLVAVAYEDPNTNPRRIGLAVSRTMGHPFQSRSVVSPPTGEASSPTVELRDSTVTVTWTSTPRPPAAARRMMRRGRIR